MVEIHTEQWREVFRQRKEGRCRHFQELTVSCLMHGLIGLQRDCVECFPSIDDVDVERMIGEIENEIVEEIMHLSVMAANLTQVAI